MIHSRRQRGSAAPFMVLAFGGALLATAYSLDTARMTNSAAQVKRATDAAAMAIGQERLANTGKSEEELRKLAYGYVANNLGLDSTLAQRIDPSSLTVRQQKDDKGLIRYKVEVNFPVDAELLGSESQYIQVHSTVEVQPSALEVALTLPNSLSENASNLAVLRKLGNHFAEQLVKGRKNAWLAVVPFSQSVNVSPDYTEPASRTPVGPGPSHMQRLSSWAMPSALRPIELSSLFRSGYAGLHDRRIPDRRANLLCMYRGLKPGENYFWDRSPVGQFRLYYRHDLPVNGSPGAAPIRWIGPNPLFGQATGADDTRFMVADKGCPSAPLLPLTNDLNKIEQRLDQMTTRFNTNYAIAMGWSAMALSPAFRGSNGWNLPNQLPKDFKDDGGDSYKAVVMLVNTTGERWFDTDAYNAPVGQNIRDVGEEKTITQRFSNLCESFRKRKIRFYMIAVGQDEIANNDLGAEGTTVDGASSFRRIAGPGLERCAVNASDITYIPGFDFASVEGRLKGLLDNILADIRQQSAYIRLIE